MYKQLKNIIAVIWFLNIKPNIYIRKFRSTNPFNESCWQDQNFMSWTTFSTTVSCKGICVSI